MHYRNRLTDIRNKRKATKGDGGDGGQEFGLADTHYYI